MTLMRLIRARQEVSPDATVFDAVRAMADGKVGAVAVTDGDRLAGIFTERDLVTRVVLPGLVPAETRVRDVMTHPVHTVPVTTGVAEAAALMQDYQVRHLVVLDQDGDFLGVVGISEILFELTGKLEVKVDDLETYIMTDGPGG
jgi:CBS domain-containing protein